MSLKKRTPGIFLNEELSEKDKASVMGGARVGLWTYFLKVLKLISIECIVSIFIFIVFSYPFMILADCFLPIQSLSCVTWLLFFVDSYMLCVFVTANSSNTIHRITKTVIHRAPFQSSGLIVFLWCSLGLVWGDISVNLGTSTKQSHMLCTVMLLFSWEFSHLSGKCA